MESLENFELQPLDKFWKICIFRKDQRLLGVDDRLPRSKKVKFQESKSGVGVENCWKSRSGSRESISKTLESESGVDFKKSRVEVGVGSRL